MRRNILVTGGCGFIGSNFINYILDTYDDVKIINIDKLDYCSATWYVKYQSNYDKYFFVKGCINDQELVTKTLHCFNIKYVIHFAAQTHVDNSFEHSLDYTKDNILGTHTLLECCRLWGNIQRFIHISTDEVYGEIDLHSKDCCEKSLLNPTNPYAATKAGAEFIVRSYYYSFQMPIIIIRANNVYGRHQYPEKLIPKFITLLKKDLKLTIQGKGDTRRNFIYVDDIVRAIATIFDKGSVNNIYNIGTNNEYSVMDIAKILLSKMKGCDAKLEDWIEYIPDRNFNDFRYAIDSSLVKSLGWKEEVEFENGIDETIAWYIRN
jgi:dTDP-glucose 4,6-dehydratase/UDP-glucose 4,6-dehydratase